jgi:catechol 2,3-dioxygenase-like lactoylglutathione lyase family enzyme
MSTNTSTAPDSAVDGLQGESVSVSFTTKDLKASVAWYRDVLGLVVAQEYEREGALRAVAMQAGAVRILLNQDDGGRGWDRVKGEGFAIQITTAQSIDAIADRVRANGGQLDTEPADMPWGARVFRLRDPDGFKLSVSSPRKA